MKSIMCIISELSHQVHSSLILYCLEHANGGRELLRNSSPVFAIHLLRISLKIFDKRCSSDFKSFCKSCRIILDSLSYAAFSNNLDNVDEVITQLYFNLFLTVPQLVSELVETSVMTLSGESCSCQEAVARILHNVTRLWSDKLFVHSPHKKRDHAFLTRVIIHCLDYSESGLGAAPVITRDNLLAAPQGGNSSPLALLLSIGVSYCLDSSDKDIRLNGMRVAKRYSARMGREICFDELNEFEANESMDPTLPAPLLDKSDDGMGTNGPASHAESDDESIKGFEIEDESHFVDKKFKTNYLRDCLEYLRYPESKPDAWKRHKYGLERIPVIMAHKPFDGRDLAVSLIKELLQLPNSFNLEGFDEKKSAAVQAIAVCYPQLVVPELGVTVSSKKLSLGIRLQSIAYMRAVASALSNPTSSTELKPMETITEEAPTIYNSSKTRIKRPQFFALKKFTQQEAGTNRPNSFAEVSDFFFFPVLKLLSDMLRPISVNILGHERQLLEGAEEFNLISELLEPADSSGLSIHKASEVRDKIRVVGVEEMKTRQLHRRGVASASQITGVLQVEEGMDALLPADALLALSVFCQCSRNTLRARAFAKDVVVIAMGFTSASAASIRRAALVAMHSAMQSFLASFSNTSPTHNTTKHSSTALDVLTNISIAEETNEAEALHIFSEPCMVAAVDWAASSIKKESDNVSRTLLIEIVKLATESVDIPSI